jgi:hypothetical protein
MKDRLLHIIDVLLESGIVISFASALAAAFIEPKKNLSQTIRELTGSAIVSMLVISVLHGSDIHEWVINGIGGICAYFAPKIMRFLSKELDNPFDFLRKITNAFKRILRNGKNDSASDN